uniref:D-serine dehydratase n=1 Tax=Arcella intermedia TaxID=1963864 RepID=A0A6B2L6F0_9EUKA
MPTPACLIDWVKYQKNCDSLLTRIKKNGICLRAMTKTHKTIEGTLYQLYGSQGIQNLDLKQLQDTNKIVISTMTEAEFFASHGFTDILYPYPPSVDKLKRAYELTKAGKRMSFSVDNLDVLENLEKFAAEKDVQFRVYIDMDPCEHRTGIEPNNPLGLELAKRISQSKHLILHGIYVHAGNSYHSTKSEEIKKVAQLERDLVVGFKEKLKEHGYDVPVVAVGSTPTATQMADNMQGVNEFHPGNYTCFDAHQAAIGTCSLDDCAATVLTRVVSTHQVPYPRMVIDAGGFALSKDLGPTHIVNQEHPYDKRQFGVVVGHPELWITSVSQEVGIIVASPNHQLDVTKFPVGTLLRIIPNHSCYSSYCYEKLYIVKDDTVIDQWKTCPRH